MVFLQNKINDITAGCTDSDIKLPRAWLKLGVSALALAGMFAILLVLARTPYFHAIIPYKEFFRTALIIHVNLSVLVWLMACAGMLWSFAIRHLTPLSWFAWILATTGTILLAISPFIAEGNPLMNNYVPILQNTLFFWGLGIFSAGIMLQSIVALISYLMYNIRLRAPETIIPAFALASGAMMVIVAFHCLLQSYWGVTHPDIRHLLDAEQYYELLFWGAGHVLQFLYVQLMLLAWLWIAQKTGISICISATTLLGLFALNLIIVITSLYPYFHYEVTDFEYLDFFTQQMRWGGGITAIILGAAIAWGWRNKTDTPHHAARNALFWSILLFGAGGILALMISGVNTIIPAHYHGSVVGVTLSLMGVVYLLVPQLGYGSTERRMSRWQPMFYGGGQLLHIIGFALSGGYGALRKTPGAMETLEAKMAMGLMGLGGLLSIIGGVLFVVVILLAMRKKDCVAEK